MRQHWPSGENVQTSGNFIIVQTSECAHTHIDGVGTGSMGPLRAKRKLSNCKLDGAAAHVTQQTVL